MSRTLHKVKNSFEGDFIVRAGKFRYVFEDGEEVFHNVPSVVAEKVLRQFSDRFVEDTPDEEFE